MLDTFFDKKCNIWETSFAKVNWSQTKTKNSIYSNIDCDFYKWTWWGLWQSQSIKEEDLNKYTVILKKDKTLIRQWQYIELIDNDLWSEWTFIVETVLAYRLPNWQIDNIELKVKPSIWNS